MAGGWIEDRRLRGLAVLLAASLLLAGCGSSGASTAAGGKPEATWRAKTMPRVPCGPPNKSMRFTGRTGAKNPGEPDVRPPCAPAPRKLVVIDLEHGSGPPARFGDKLSVRFAGAHYRNGHVFYGDWFRDGFPIELGDKTRPPGLELGIRGMKAGGRRELLVPPTLSAESGSLIYIVDLLKIEAK